MRTILSALILTACAHTAPVATPNHAVEFVTLLDHGAKCEDWRTTGSPVHSALCLSAESLFWCVAPSDSKPKCELLFDPKAAKEAAKAKPVDVPPPTMPEIEHGKPHEAPHVEPGPAK